MGFLIGIGGRDDDDIHTSDLSDLIVVDLREDQLFLDAKGVVSMSVEGIVGNASEVTDAREGDGDEFIIELIHPGSSEGDFAADGLSLTKFEGGDGLLSLGDHGSLSGDGGKFSHGVIEGFGVAGGIANADVDDYLLEFRGLHRGGVAKLFDEGRHDFLFVFLIDPIDGGGSFGGLLGLGGFGLYWFRSLRGSGFLGGCGFGSGCFLSSYFLLFWHTLLPYFSRLSPLALTLIFLPSTTFLWTLTPFLALESYRATLEASIGT